MKTNYLIGLAVIAMSMLTSCSNDENIEMPKSDAIAFSSFVDKGTRATDITNGNITNFSVYGFVDKASGTVFSNETVTGAYGGDWSYTNTQYWIPGKTYYFTAIAPATDADWTFAPLTGDATGQGGVITFTNDGKQDLLYAYKGNIEISNPITSTPGKVDFTYRHMLSRVKFNFKNSMGNANTTLKITSIKIMNANQEGTIDVANPSTMSWTITADKIFELNFGGIDNAIANDGNADVGHMYLIPANQTYKMEFVVEMYSGDVLLETYSHTGENAVTVPLVEMAAGNSYVFNAELNYQTIDPENELYPIEFTVTDVADWADWTTGNDNNIVPAP